MIELCASGDPVVTLGEFFRDFPLPEQGVVFVFRLRLSLAVDMGTWSSSSNDETRIPSAPLAASKLVEVRMNVPVEPGWMGRLLDEDENGRALRIHNVDSRLTYMFAHALVRVFFASRLEVAPETLSFTRSTLGRPELRGQSGALDFNISYRRGLVAFAVSPYRVGVDLEVFPTRINYRGIAQRFFSPRESRFVVSSDDVERRFLWVWTRHEALVKFLGLGIDAIGQHDVMPERVEVPNHGVCRISSWSKPDYMLSCVNQE